MLKIGVPCHFRPTNENRSSCGIEHPTYSAYDGRDVDCLRCMKTKKWRIYMGVGEFSEQNNGQPALTDDLAIMQINHALKKQKGNQ